MSKIGKNIGFAARVLASKLTGRRFPLSVTFISTYKCNFTCEYCDVWRYKEHEMTTKEALSMIDQFAKLGTRRFSFNGGEPLLRPDLGILIDRCRERGMFTTMFSNGSLVAKNVDKLKGLDILTISLDGPKEVHERQRMAGTYDKVIEGIKAAKAAGLKVWTNTVITKDNLDYLCALTEEAKSLGVKMIFQPVLHYSHSAETSRIHGLGFNDIEYKNTITRLKQLKKNGAPIVHSDEYLDYIKVPVWPLNRRRCYAGELYCAVTPVGDVAPCYPIFSSKRWPNGLALGFGKAFADIGSFTCNGCFCALVESDFLYSLKPGPVLNLLRSVEAV